MIKLLISI